MVRIWTVGPTLGPSPTFEVEDESFSSTPAGVTFGVTDEEGREVLRLIPWHEISRVDIDRARGEQIEVALSWT